MFGLLKQYMIRVLRLFDTHGGDGSESAKEGRGTTFRDSMKSAWLQTAAITYFMSNGAEVLPNSGMGINFPTFKPKGEDEAYGDESNDLALESNVREVIIQEELNVGNHSESSNKSEGLSSQEVEQALILKNIAAVNGDEVADGDGLEEAGGGAAPASERESADTVIVVEGDAQLVGLDAAPQILIAGGVGSSDVLIGGAGDDIIIGSNQSYGNNGSDILIGGAGDDVILGGGDGSSFGGLDVLDGGAGDDILTPDFDIYFGGHNYVQLLNIHYDIPGPGRYNVLVQPSPGMYVLRSHDEIIGGPGFDILRFSNGDGQYLNPASPLLGGSTTLSGIERIEAGAGNDFIQPNIHTDIELIGGTGDDFLLSGAGNDLIEGGEGNDLLFGYLGDDFLIGGSGMDTFLISTRDAYNTPAASISSQQDIIGDLETVDTISIYHSGHFDLTSLDADGRHAVVGDDDNNVVLSFYDGKTEFVLDRVAFDNNTPTPTDDINSFTDLANAGYSIVLNG